MSKIYGEVVQQKNGSFRAIFSHENGTAIVDFEVPSVAEGEAMIVEMLQELSERAAAISANDPDGDNA